MSDLFLFDRVLEIIRKITPIIKASRVTLIEKCELELSHHYGINKYEEYGAAIFNIINREYCKKILVMLPGQKHPEHYHVKKEETFHILFGDLTIYVNKISHPYNPYRDTEDNLIIIKRTEPHSFFSDNGCVFEEVSTTSHPSDSFYSDDLITQNNDNRKTKLTFHKSWLTEGVK